MRIYTLITALILTASMSAQCYEDRHNTTWYDAWVSCETTVGPIASYGESHWIQYDLGHQYYLGEMQVWNINDPIFLTRGAQEIFVDISEDGENWTNQGTYVLNQGSGMSIYEGEVILDFQSAQARYVLITISSTYGANCGGISELKIDVNGINTDIAEFETPNACFEVAVFPNPHTDLFNAKFSSTCPEDMEVKLFDAMGRLLEARSLGIVIEEQVLQFGGADFPAGVYYLSVEQAGSLGRYHIVKTR